MKKGMNKIWSRLASLAVVFSLLLCVIPFGVSAESDGMLHGIIVDSSYNASLASFSPDDPENVTTGNPNPTDINISAAEYYHGNYYCYSGSNGLFYVFSADTFELLYTGSTSQGVMFADMSFDYSTGKMYALIADSYVSTSCIYEVDMTNGNTVKVFDSANLTDPFGERLNLLGIACSTDGTIYACDANMLYTIDLEAGTYSPVGSMLVFTQNSPTFSQSLSFDHYTGTLYFAATYYGNTGMVSDLYVVNTVNGISTRVGSIGSDCSLVGLNCAYTPDDLPAVEPTGVTVTPSSGIIQVGNTIELSAAVASNPAGFAADFEICSIEWSSDNEAVATVDAGIVTAVSPGEAHITATVETEFEGVPYILNGEALITVSPEPAADVTIHAIDTYPSNYMNMFEVIGFNTYSPQAVETEFSSAGNDFLRGTAYWNGYYYYCTGSNAMYRISAEAGSTPELIRNTLPDGYAAFNYIMVNPVDGQAYAVSYYDFWYVSLARLDLETGEVEMIGTLENIGSMLYGSGIRSITIGANGKCYAISADNLYSENKLYEIDLDTAVGTYICDVDIDEFVSGGMCYCSEGNCLYAVSNTSVGGYMLYEIDPEAGTTVNLGSCADMGYVSSIYIIEDIDPIPQFTIGDVNNDGQINAADANLAMRMALNLMEALPAADANEDGNITAADANIIMRWALNLG